MSWKFYKHSSTSFTFSLPPFSLFVFHFYSKSANWRDILHNPDNNHIPKTQEKAQKDLIKKFEGQKIKSDILKTIYEKEGIEGTLVKVMFLKFIIETII
ncbi:MAG: hypothetical protein U9P71_07635 [Campylobacterota bacterium]|nr:hypothetical protein [Campylobacterota bacterium]